tara:strand:- start:1486 stop:4548 length:3063 start_codon:yes stop_codon:yes gene_type:complete
MQKKKTVQIILGAGKPFSGYQNSSLKKVSKNTYVLDWTLQATKFLNPEVHYVAGYQINELISRYPNLIYTINPDWENTGPIVSLLKSRVDPNSDFIISYSDILFRESTVKKLLSLNSDICIAVDSKWKDRYLKRSLKDIKSSEKVLVDKDLLLESGNVSLNKANAEFIGLIYLKSKAMKYFQDNSKIIQKKMKRSTLVDLLSFFKSSNFKVKVLDVKGDWAELNKRNDIANFILGTKAQSLARLEKVLKFSKIAPQISFTIIDWKKNSKKIITKIQNKFDSLKVIIRSSAISEDGFNNSMAGAYLSILDINTNSKEDLSDSISKVINSYSDNNPLNEVLVQPMINNVINSGVIFTRTLSHSAPYYVISFDENSNKTDTITSGSVNDYKTLMILKSRFKDIEVFVPKNLRGILPALKEVENLLDFYALDLEFAIDKRNNIHLLQVRPLTNTELDSEDESVFDSIDNCIIKFKNLQKNSPFILGDRAIFGIMPDWNPAEIIGTNPYSLSFDLYRYLITDEIWATQRAEFGYKDVRPQPLLVSFAGHPYVDVRASFNSFIPSDLSKSLSKKLVNCYIKRLCVYPHFHDKIEFEILPTCYDLNFQKWKSILVEENFSNEEIDELESGLKKITQNSINRTLTDLLNIEKVKKNFDDIYSSDLSDLDKALALLEDCRRQATLIFAHLARSAFISVSLLKSAVEINAITQDAMNSFLNSIKTVAHEFLVDAKKTYENNDFWPEFIKLYGHLRPGTYDITSENYANNVKKYLEPVVNKSNDTNEDIYKEKDCWKDERKNFLNAVSDSGITVNVNSLETFMKSAIEGREYAKFIFTKNLSFALDLIENYGKKIGLDKYQLANISLNSLFDIKTGKINHNDAFTHLKKESESQLEIHNKNKKIELPPLITNESEFKVFTYPNSQPNYIGSDRITAEIYNLDIKNNLGDSVQLDNKILLIPQADPGYDWIFGHNISGLITMYGGGNSHMAIRAKEFGIPAVLGVGETIYKSLLSSNIIDLDVVNRKIEIVK